MAFHKLSRVALFVTCICFAASLWAQKDAGAIVGIVRDKSGAVVSGAKVTVTDTDRGSNIALTTNDAGEYLSGPLRIGHYKVTVEKAGFKKSVSETVEVNIQDRVAVDIALQPGAVSETIEVTAAGPQLETETSEIGQLVDQRRINALPLNGRNYAQLALLGPGVAPAEPGARTETTYGFSSNGARSLQNNFLLDGIDNNANLGDVLNGAAYVVQPSVDAIAEFKVETNSYSAEFGRGNGAIMNAVIKSGTNQLHGDLFEFVRNEKFDAINKFDIFGQQPYKQNQFGFTLGGPIRKNKTFFFGDYEGERIRQALPQLVQVPTQAEILNGDFSALLDTSVIEQQIDPNTGLPNGLTAVDCNGNPTYQGEIFNSRLVQNSAVNASGLCGVPINGNAPPTNIFPAGGTDPLASTLAAYFPAPNAAPYGPQAFLSDPKRSETDNKFDIRLDQIFSQKDNFFVRFSFGNSNNFLPSPFQNVLDGGSFQDGYSENDARGVAASEIHSFRPNLINELRFGFNHLYSHRLNLNYNVDVAQQLNFPGVPFGPDLGGLPSISFSNGDQAIGSSGYQPAVEKQYSYVIGDNLIWSKGRHAAKFGGELRFEEFTILEPAAPRGDLTFGSDFTDNPAAPGTGGDAFATFLLGIPDSGEITGVNNIIYRRQIYSAYALDDFKVTPRLTLNLGLRYEFFSTIKEANNLQSTFDFPSQSLIVPSALSASAAAFPTSDTTLASELAISNTGSRGLIHPDYNNFAPRIGLAYQITDKLVLRSGYGIFYGGQENGPFSNPSPGYNPPFSISQVYSTNCSSPAANAAVLDCSLPGLNVLSQGFPSDALSNPNTPSLYSIAPHLVTPYTQQWHLGFEYQLPSQTVLELTYGGSRGLKLYGFYNGNQATADPNSLDALAPRRPANNANWPGGVGQTCSLADQNGAFCNPALNATIATLRSNDFSNYNSLQARLEKRFSHGVQFEAAYTFAHALDDASSASLGSVNNGDFRNQLDPALEYGNADFDVRQRFVFSYEYDLPFGHGKAIGGGAHGALNQIIGNWQMAGVLSIATGNFYTATDIEGVSNADCGGTVGFYCTHPNIAGNPNATPCIPGTLFNTCAFSHNTIQGTYGDAGRNIILGPGYKEWDTSFVKEFPVHEQMHFEFRAELFNVLNKVNYLFSQFGSISAEPVALELDPSNLNTPQNPNASQFGYAQAARAPRQIQLALKFYF
jgi:hypothetical protein